MAFGPDRYASSPARGLDASWIACDRDGHVAWLVSFVSGVLPAWILAHYDDCPEVETPLGQLAERSEGRVLHDDGHVAEWATMARRGLFAFDWDVHSGPYRLLAAPTNAITIDDLPPSLQAVVRRSCLRHLCFASVRDLSVEDVERAVDL